ncbi:MAG: hypothetical protein AAF711_11970 [Planctomycetota bacterium]
MQIWKPSSRPITYAEWLESGLSIKQLVIHFWAEWNSVDRLVDIEVIKAQENIDLDIEYRSFDIQEKIAWPWLRDNERYGYVPCIVGFKYGEEIGHLIGRRFAQEYESVIKSWFSE